MPKGSIRRKVFGRSILDEAGTAGGFLVGGPGGAAVGRGLGVGAATGDIGKAARGAVEGYAMGTGAKMLAGGGPGGALRRLVGGGGGAAGAPPAGGGGGGLLGGIGRAADWVTANPQRTALLTGAMSTGAGIMGGRQAGAVADRERQFAEQQATKNDADRKRLLELFMQRLGGAAPPAGAP
ncbi:MAG: hypothetical protein KY467_01230 [Gemmatimonadetes bacterium]|nr:hypothetical protein [Gemmatimonadota bacterium]